MDSLRQLNTYSDTGFAFDDDRPTIIEFDPASPVNQSITTLEDQAFSSPWGIDIVNMQSAANVNYQVNIAACPGATVTWNEVPDWMTVTTPATNVYQIDNIIGVSNWQQVRSPSILTPSGFAGNFTYTSTIFYPTGNTKTWTTSVRVTDTLEITQPTSFTYNEDTFTTITGNPVIIDTAIGSSYQLTITPNVILAVDSISSGGSDGSTEFVDTTKSYVITGTKTEVNSHLNTLTFVPGHNYVDNFQLIYSLKNLVTLSTTVVYQPVAIGIQYAEITTPGSVTYDEDVAFVLQTYPVADDTYNTSYVLTIQPNNTAAIYSLSSSGSVSSSSFNSATRTLTVAGLRDEINTHLQNFTITPAVDYANDFVLQYRLRETATQVWGNVDQTFFIGNTNTETANAAVARSYTGNTPEFLFASSPIQIAETAVGSAAYTTYTANIALTANVGYFTANASGAADARWNATTRTYSITGSRDLVNNTIPALLFVPYRDVSTSTYLTYTQSRAGVAQTTANVALTGTAYTGTPVANQAGTFVFTTNGNITITPQQAYYLTCDILIVGGGGSGGRGIGTRTGPNAAERIVRELGGGGGAGGLIRFANTTFAQHRNATVTANVTYPIVVGSGGARLAANSGPVNGSRGENSSAFGLTARGGGYGGGGLSSTYAGGAGGSGGGSGYYAQLIAPAGSGRYVSVAGGNGISGQGTPGGFAGNLRAYASGPNFDSYWGWSAGAGGGYVSNTAALYGFQDNGSFTYYSNINYFEITRLATGPGVTGGLVSNITGTAVGYAYGGSIISDTTGGPIPNNTGSGGSGLPSTSSYDNRGSDGIVVVKFY